MEHAHVSRRISPKHSYLVVTCVLLAVCAFVSPPGLNAKDEDEVSVKASPRVSVDPGKVNILVRHVPQADDRSLTVEIESLAMLRSSVIDLEGQEAPAAHWMEFRNLPQGSYVVRAVVGRSGEEESGYAQTSFRVIGTAELSGQR